MRYWRGLTIMGALLLLAVLVKAEKPLPPESEVEKLAVEIQIGSGIEDRQPTGVAGSYPANTAELVGWTRVRGAKEPTEVWHIWKRDGKHVSRVKLSVQSSNFRTYSRVDVSGPGKWTLIVENFAGRELATKEVLVGAP